MQMTVRRETALGPSLFKQTSPGQPAAEPGGGSQRGTSGPSTTSAPMKCSGFRSMAYLGLKQILQCFAQYCCPSSFGLPQNR